MVYRLRQRIVWIFCLLLVMTTPVNAEEIDFSLTTPEGSWSLAQLRGQVVLLFFGYTSCPDVCPTTMQTVSQAFDLLEPNLRKKVHGVFISLDPERDSHANLATYARYFNDQIVALSGTPAELRQTTETLGVSFRKNGGGDDYTIDHSSLLFVIDASGQKRTTYVAHDVPADYLANQLRDLLTDS